MDAASNGGKDEIRDLIERAAYTPGIGRFKVFMIDEAHQLSTPAFNALLKTLTASDYVQYLGQYWRAGRMHMINHQSGKETALRWRDYRFRQGLGPRDFDQNTLKR